MWPLDTWTRASPHCNTVLSVHTATPNRMSQVQVIAINLAPPSPASLSMAWSPDGSWMWSFRFTSDLYRAFSR